MDSLERLFYSVSAFAAGLALLLFGLYFNLGDMVLAAVRGPASFREGIFRRNVRQAELFGVPKEVKPHEGPTVKFDKIGSGLPFKAYNGPPDLFQLDQMLEKERKYLLGKGFADPEFIEMESLYRADRAYLRGMYGVDQLVLRGDDMTALEELEALIQRTNPKNLRALLQLYELRGRLLGRLNAPPDRLYEHVMQELESRRKLHEIEMKGYHARPRMEHLFAQSEAQKGQVEKLQKHFQDKRSEAIRFFSSGLYGGDRLDPAMAKVVQAAVDRHHQRGNLIDREKDEIMDLVNTRVAAFEKARGGG